VPEDWADGEPIVMAGNSLGGAVALRAAEHHDLPLLGIVPVAPAGLESPGSTRAGRASPSCSPAGGG
jgi:pimeloyl-ACP methyl ester carboxylesterase